MDVTSLLTPTSKKSDHFDNKLICCLFFNFNYYLPAVVVIDVRMLIIILKP